MYELFHIYSVVTEDDFPKATREPNMTPKLACCEQEVFPDGDKGVTGILIKDPSIPFVQIRKSWRLEAEHKTIHMPMSSSIRDKQGEYAMDAVTKDVVEGLLVSLRVFPPKHASQFDSFAGHGVGAGPCVGAW